MNSEYKLMNAAYWMVNRVEEEL